MRALSTDSVFCLEQYIAKRGGYGAFLLEKPDMCVAIVKALHENLSIPVTCKIRVLQDVDATVELATRLQDAGCQILTVHGRTKEQNKVEAGASPSRPLMPLVLGSCRWKILCECVRVG